MLPTYLMVVLPASFALEQRATHLVAPSPEPLKGLEDLDHPSPIGESPQCADDRQLPGLGIRMRGSGIADLKILNTCIHLNGLHVDLCILDVYLPFCLIMFGCTLELLEILWFDAVLLSEFLLLLGMA